MSTSTLTLEKVIEECGLTGLLNGPSRSADPLADLRAVLAAASDESMRHPGGREFTFDEPSLLAEYDRNPHKVDAFLQTLASTQNPVMLALTWRLVQGVKMETLSITYAVERDFQLRIVLPTPDGGDDVYESSDISDAALLRHLGITRVNGRPLFDGYYPLYLA